MYEKPDLAPGCYGAAYCYADDPVCNACEFSAGCQVMRERKRQQLAAMYQIESPTRRRTGLPVKVKQIFDALGKTEQEVRDALVSGKNPYRVSDGPVGIVAHLLLQFGALPRSTLTKAVADMRQLGEETAAVYTRYAIQILTHCEAADVNGENVKLRRG